MTGAIKTQTPSAIPLSWWRRSLKHARKRLKPLQVVVSTASETLGMSRISFFLWLLLPLCLTLSSDWIGVLVVFQSMTAALRLRNTSAVKILSSGSSTSLPCNAAPGGDRVL